MPSSNIGSILGLFKSIAEINPKSILEIGVGFGKWGVLIREYFDLRPGKNNCYDKWSIKLDGIEIHEKYLTPIHDYIYNSMYIGNGLDILKEKNLYYDMILAADVIEHFTKKQGMEFLQLCKNRADNVIINTPHIYFKQDELFGNKYETHLSGWDVDDFIAEGARYLWITGINITAVFTNRELNLPPAENIKNITFEKSELKKVKDLAYMYYNTSQIQACIQICEKYILNFSDDYEFYLLLALSCEKNNDNKKAYNYAQQALDINSSSKTAMDIKKRNEKA